MFPRGSAGSTAATLRLRMLAWRNGDDDTYILKAARSIHNPLETMTPTKYGSQASMYLVDTSITMAIDHLRPRIPFLNRRNP